MGSLDKCRITSTTSTTMPRLCCSTKRMSATTRRVCGGNKAALQTNVIRPNKCVKNRISMEVKIMITCLWLKAQELNSTGLQLHLCPHEKSLTSCHPCHFLAGLIHIFSLPVHHNTKHHLDNTRRHCTPSTSSRTCTVDKQR